MDDDARGAVAVLYEVRMPDNVIWRVYADGSYSRNDGQPQRPTEMRYFTVPLECALKLRTDGGKWDPDKESWEASVEIDPVWMTGTRGDTPDQALARLFILLLCELARRSYSTPAG